MPFWSDAMIRREVAASGGAPAAWVLINQIDHAHLAFELAQHWGAPPFAPLEARDALLWTCTHHDDGWRAWDARPQVDPTSGVPRQFLEMHPAETLDIWTKSIDAAAEQGPLEGYLVAGHFCRLGRGATRDKQNAPEWQPFLAFLDDYEARASDWLSQWQAGQDAQGTATDRTAAVADRALAQLQFFDTFSLWFCCSESTDREIVETPAGIDLELHPRGSSQLRLSPWPLTVDMLELAVPGRLIEARRYADAGELAAAPSQAITLRWRLSPA
jgi:hypothetical protein